MLNTNYLIIFSKEDTFTDSAFFGFKLFEKNEAKQYMKCIKKLSEDGVSFEIDGNSYIYSDEDFSEMKLTASDIKTLNKIFDFSYEKNGLGIFPDAINDAYDLNLFDEDYNDDYNDEEYDDEI